MAEVAAGRAQYLEGFHIAFDNWHSTDGPENHQLAQDIYRDLRAAGLIEVKSIEQFFDPDKGMFLPDRFIKGECPKCGAKDQYGDACENCSAVYEPTELINPYSTLSGAANRPAILVATYFGELGSVLPALARTQIDGVAVDFVAGGDQLSGLADKLVRALRLAGVSLHG